MCFLCFRQQYKNYEEAVEDYIFTLDKHYLPPYCWLLTRTGDLYVTDAIPMPLADEEIRAIQLFCTESFPDYDGYQHLVPLETRIDSDKDYRSLFTGKMEKVATLSEFHPIMGMIYNYHYKH